MHVLHISFRNSNRNDLFNHMLRTKNVCVVEYDFFNPDDYEALLNDNYTYDALFLGSQGSDGETQKGLTGFKFINLYNSKGLEEMKRRLSELVRKYENIPILGICYGAQVLNIFHGGEISGKRDIKKTGYKSIQLDTSSPLFKGFPSYIHAEFNTWYTITPSALSSIIAVTKDDNVIAAQSFPGNHYGLYFHIMHGDDDVIREVVDNFISIVERKKNYVTIMKVSALGLLFSLYVMFV